MLNAIKLVFYVLNAKIFKTLDENAPHIVVLLDIAFLDFFYFVIESLTVAAICFII